MRARARSAVPLSPVQSNDILGRHVVARHERVPQLLTRATRRPDAEFLQHARTSGAVCRCKRRTIRVECPCAEVKLLLGDVRPPAIVRTRALVPIVLLAWLLAAIADRPPLRRALRAEALRRALRTKP